MYEKLPNFNLTLNFFQKSIISLIFPKKPNENTHQTHENYLQHSDAQCIHFSHGKKGNGKNKIVQGWHGLRNTFAHSRTLHFCMNLPRLFPRCVLITTTNKR